MSPLFRLCYNLMANPTWLFLLFRTLILSHNFSSFLDLRWQKCLCSEQMKYLHLLTVLLWHRATERGREVRGRGFLLSPARRGWHLKGLDEQVGNAYLGPLHLVWDTTWGLKPSWISPPINKRCQKNDPFWGVTNRGVSRLWHLRSRAKFFWRMSHFFEPLPSPGMKWKWDMKDAICSSNVTPPSLSQPLRFSAQGRLQPIGISSHVNALFLLAALRHGMLSSILQTVAAPCAFPPLPGRLFVSATWDTFLPGLKR